MSTEPPIEVNLDTLGSDIVIGASVQGLEAKSQHLVTLQCSISSLDRARSMLSALRAANIAGVLLVKREENLVDDDEVLPILSLLHDWDQLLLQNFLEFCLPKVPEGYRPSLQVEAKLELKWFKEWLTAAHDPRIYKYPGLPWRSFIRKVVAENFVFAENFLKLTETDNRKQELDALLKNFLVAKKKVLCVFPKNWGPKNFDKNSEKN